MARKYGSATPEEMAERMRAAGYEDWEIADEMGQAQWLAEARRRGTESLLATGQLAPGTSIEEVGRPAMERAAADIRSDAREEGRADTRRAMRREEEIDMAKSNSGFTMHIPESYGGRASVNHYKRESDGALRAAVTLPPRTSIKLDDGTSYDASFHSLFVSNNQVRPAKEGGYSVWLPGPGEDGQMPEVWVSRSVGHKDDAGNWVEDSRSEMQVATAALAEAVENPVVNRVSVSIPKVSMERDTLRYFTSKEGRELAALKLPPHTAVVDTEGVEQPAAFFEFVVPATSVRAYDNDPNYYSVSLPRANREGEVWEVTLQRSEGHWENPEAAAPEERGEWVDEGTTEIRATSDSLKQAMEEYRADVRAFAESAASPEQPERAQERTIADRVQEMTGIKDKEFFDQHVSVVGDAAPKKAAGKDIEIPQQRTQADDKRTIAEDAVIAGLAASAVVMAKPTVEKSRTV